MFFVCFVFALYQNDVNNIQSEGTGQRDSVNDSQARVVLKVLSPPRVPEEAEIPRPS